MTVCLNFEHIRVTNCRVKRHLLSTPTHKHSRHAELNLEQRFLRSREKSELQSNWQGHKLYSKVLTIEPNRLLIKYFLFDKGAWLRLCLFIVPLLDDHSKPPTATHQLSFKRTLNDHFTQMKAVRRHRVWIHPSPLPPSRYMHRTSRPCHSFVRIWVAKV